MAEPQKAGPRTNKAIQGTGGQRKINRPLAPDESGVFEIPLEQGGESAGEAPVQGSAQAGLGAAALLGASQNRDRMLRRREPAGQLGPMPIGKNATPLPARLGGGGGGEIAAPPTSALEGGAPLDQFAAASYAAQGTKEQREVSRQRAMMETARRFLAGGAEPSAPRAAPRGEEAPRRGIEQRGGEQELGPGQVGTRQARTQAALQQGQQMSRTEALKRKLQDRLAESRLAQQAEQRYRKLSKNVRRLLKAIQAAGAKSLISLVTLTFQANLEVINKWVTKIKTPKSIAPVEPAVPDDDEFVAACANCVTCVTCLTLNAKLIFIIILATIIAGSVLSIVQDLKFIFNILGN